jgi:hypothetical protein
MKNDPTKYIGINKGYISNPFKVRNNISIYKWKKKAQFPNENTFFDLPVTVKQKTTNT